MRGENEKIDRKDDRGWSLKGIERAQMLNAECCDFFFCFYRI